MQEFYPEDHRFYLKNELELRLKRRPQYSLRAFARDLNLSPSTLSEFLNGLQGFSRDTVNNLAVKINLTESHRDHLWNLIEAKFSRNVQKKIEAQIRVKSRLLSQQSKVSLDEFRFIADWYHLAILELIELSPKYQNRMVMADALGINENQVLEAIDRLLKLKLLNLENGILVLSSETTNVGENVPSESVRLFHSQIIAKAHEALEMQTVERRDYSSTIFSIAKEDLPELKKELSRACISIANKYAAREMKNSVYCLSVQLFDLLNEKESIESGK